MPQLPLSLYLHIPFCHAKCAYCDFNTYAGIGELVPDYLHALEREIRAWGAALAADSEHTWEVGTIFFGGGTPTFLSAEQLLAQVDHIRSAFAVTADAEISVEANPGTLDRQSLMTLRNGGVNRLSLGVQSFDDALLKLLGRIHSADEAVDGYRLARDAGFDNINLDFIYGLPDQTLEHWKQTVRRSLDLAPDHLSLYCLTVEHGTPLARWVATGKVQVPDGDQAADMYLVAEELLGEAGYEHYEISNWAKPGRGCRHNLTYWRNQPYLGFGAGAHSSFRGRRFFDALAPRRYIRRWGKGSIAEDGAGDMAEHLIRDLSGGREEIGPELERGETMMLGLRLAEGIDKAAFAHRFGRSLGDCFGKEIAELVSYGLLEENDHTLRLTPRGRLLANDVFIRFLPAQ